MFLVLVPGKAAMRRADRLFDIIQALRTAKKPMTAATLADQLEVTVRTVYRDIATLQARRVPIEGAAGIGYLLRGGFDLPPLMFTECEIEAIAVGMRMLRRTGDRSLHAAARGVLSKVTSALPDALRQNLAAPPVYVSHRGAPAPANVDLAAVRGAIRDARKLALAYSDGEGERTRRVVWPVAIAYYAESTLICAWCELRGDFRHFRADRIKEVATLTESFAAEATSLRDGWLALTRPQ
jgi:predicted DNA-binding transcriptional regulator YafY